MAIDTTLNVAFFPAFPLLTLGLQRISGWNPETSALPVAHAGLMAAFILLARYVRLRWPESSDGQRALAVLMFGLWPASLFYRLAYAESLFLVGTLAVLYGMARGWPLIILALGAGFVTATRPVGIALSGAFAWYILTRPNHSSRTASLIHLLFCFPIASWGLLAFMAYQAVVFGAPFGFAQTQAHWTTLPCQPDNWQSKLYSLVALEPVWGVYVPGGPRYWGNLDMPGSPFLSMAFWNPILFLGAAALLVVGSCKRWLTGAEIVLGILLLAIPYLTRSYEMSMLSHGRFAGVVVVNYLVLGRLLAHFSFSVTVVGLAWSILLFSWAALFAAGYTIV